MAVGVRARFEVFKRDGFQCRYCGKRSPEVVLECDHAVPVCEGGTDDPMNLVTACWDCNRGKSGVALSQVMTGEDPHDRAVLMLERERQLREYNAVLESVHGRIAADLAELKALWGSRPTMGFEWDTARELLEVYPAAAMRLAMERAIERRKTSCLAGVFSLLRKWGAQRPQGAPIEHQGHELGLGAFPGSRERPVGVVGDRRPGQ